jgi:hypothetical protein
MVAQGLKSCTTVEAEARIMTINRSFLILTLLACGLHAAAAAMSRRSRLSSRLCALPT